MEKKDCFKVFLIFSLIYSFNFMKLPTSDNNTVKLAGASVYGDDYLRRVIVVNQSFNTYFDDFLYCAAIPAAIHWEGESKHESLLIQDRDTRMINNLYSDWDCYLDKIGGCQHVDYIGEISDERKTEINGYYGNPLDIQQVSSSQDIYEAAIDIATYYWGSERNASINTAVLCYVPDVDGGIEKDETLSGVNSGINEWIIPVNSSNIGWIDAEISWTDANNSNYELSITDPYATHAEKYTTVTDYFEPHESQTNNVLHDNEGYEHITMSPYYSWSADPDFNALENWIVEQPISGIDDYNYTITQYRIPDEDAITSVMNGAVVASLLDVPIIYTSGLTVEPATMAALDTLNIKNLIIIDPHDKINENQWKINYSVKAYSDEISVFNYVYSLGSAKTSENDVIIPAVGGAWFTTAALVGAYHAGPVALPVGDLIKNATARSTNEWWDQISYYLKYDFLSQTSGSPDDPPTWNDMVQISNDTFNWLESFNTSFNPICNDLNCDGVPDVGDSFNYSEDVDIIIVSPLNAIKLNFDGAMIGKGSVGRFAFADPVLSGAWAARCMLYWYVGFSDTDNYANLNDQPAETNHWDHAGYTFVAYTHDDGIIDDDLGDDEDDDFPGGNLTMSYYMSDELPQYAAQYGMLNEFNTHYDEVKTMLEDGLALWVHADHGKYNSMMETGDGLLGLSNKTENPWREYDDTKSVDMPNLPNGNVNPSVLNATSGGDWYYGLNNVHSTMIYFQDCQFGASRGPLFFAELGATSMVADICSMYVDPSPVYNDRLVKGLCTGNTIGAANRWAIDESGPIYSLQDPPPDDLGYSIQCVVYGDPELVLTTETLWIYADWTLNSNTIDIQIYNQSGEMTLPGTITVSIDGSTTGFTLISHGAGRYSINNTFKLGKHSLKIEVSGNNFHDCNHDTSIVREYVFNGNGGLNNDDPNNDDPNNGDPNNGGDYVLLAVIGGIAIVFSGGVVSIGIIRLRKRKLDHISFSLF